MISPKSSLKNSSLSKEKRVQIQLPFLIKFIIFNVNTVTKEKSIKLYFPLVLWRRVEIMVEVLKFLISLTIVSSISQTTLYSIIFINESTPFSILNLLLHSAQTMYKLGYLHIPLQCAICTPANLNWWFIINSIYRNWW